MRKNNVATKLKVKIAWSHNVIEELPFTSPPNRFEVDGDGVNVFRSVSKSEMNLLQLQHHFNPGLIRLVGQIKIDLLLNLQLKQNHILYINTSSQYDLQKDPCSNRSDKGVIKERCIVT